MTKAKTKPTKEPKEPKAPKATKTKIQAGGIAFPRLDHHSWIIVGIDLSLSRTGLATLHIKGDQAKWGYVGSLTPADSKEETWARAATLGIALREHISQLQTKFPNTPMIISVEFPDPNNSYLMGLNQVIQTVLWTADEEGGPAGPGKHVYRLAVNASTLRAAMRLSGSDTKADNIALAYDYIDKGEYPRLDSDSCDAVLLAMFGRHAAMVLSGHEDLVPQKPLVTLCSEAVAQKTRTNEKTGAVKVMKETPKGILHNPATWTRIRAPKPVRLRASDARATSTRSALTTTYNL
jgi:hypothetical protein